MALPSALSVSQLVELAADPDALAARLRRPMPFPPNPHTRRGTAFHAWLEQRFGATRLLDLDELPGAADDGAADDDELDALRAAFLTSEWADRRPTEVEVSFETEVDGIGVRGRMDAVFAWIRTVAGRWWIGRPAPCSDPAAAAGVIRPARRLLLAGLGRAGRL